jgi:S1-C subfamily serine protease
MNRRIGLLIAAAVFALGACGPKTEKPAEAPKKADPCVGSAGADVQKKATLKVSVEPSNDIKAAFRGALPGTAFPKDVAEFALGAKAGGSAFVVSRGGKQYAITNRHVVESAPTAELTLDEHSVLRNCKVVYTDRIHDLAIIELPENGASGVPQVALGCPALGDNAEVQASGFPRVGDEQSYRLTNGTISNAAFTVKTGRREQKYVQHTAALDHGNSGGPLFSKGTLVLAGVNTLSVPMNANLYAAIPPSAIEEAFGRMDKVPAEGNVEQMKASLTDACVEFLQEFELEGEVAPSTLAIVSDELSARLGPTAYTIGARGDFDEAANVLRLAVRKGFVLSYMRGMVFKYIFGYVKGRNGGLAPSSSGSSADMVCHTMSKADLENYASVGYVRNIVPMKSNEKATFFWKLQQGHWVLADVKW